MPRSEELYLRDMLDACEALGRFIDGRTLEEIVGDEVLSAAILQKLIVIGEAASRLSDEFRERHTELGWHRMAAMRNVAVHAYFSIRWPVVWTTLTESVPRLRDDLRRLLDQTER